MIAARAALSAGVEAFAAEVLDGPTIGSKAGTKHDRGNDALHSARNGLHDMADRCQDLIRQLDLAARLGGQVVDIATKELEARKSEIWTNSNVNAARRSVDNARTTDVEALTLTRYFVRQADWLHDRFPEAKLRDVEGLVNVGGPGRRLRRTTGALRRAAMSEWHRKKRTRVSIFRRRCA